MRAAKRQKFSGPMVTIVVGASEDGYSCHDALETEDNESAAGEAVTQESEIQEANTQDHVAEEETTEEPTEEEITEDEIAEEIESEEFVVHAAVLKTSSKFFEAALAKRWKEGASLIIHLPDDEPEITHIYFDWLYSREIISEDRTEPMDTDMHGAEGVRLAKCYVFGENIQDDDFCDDVLHAFIELFSTVIKGCTYYAGVECIKILYEGTLERSPVRRFIADIFADVGRQEWMETYRSVAHECPDFAVDIAIALLPPDNSRKEKEAVFQDRSKWMKKTERETQQTEAAEKKSKEKKKRK